MAALWDTSIKKFSDNYKKNFIATIKKFFSQIQTALWDTFIKKNYLATIKKFSRNYKKKFVRNY